MNQPPMIPSSDIITIAGSVLQGLKEAKSLVEKIPVSLLPWDRSNVEALQKKMASLEKAVTVGFPKMAQLIRAYSSLISEIKVSKALADKMSELTILAPRLTEIDIIVSGFINQLENNHGRISTNVSQLSSPDVSERGMVDVKLANVRDTLRDLKNLDKTDLKMMKQYFDRISTDYADVEGSLSRLLEKILTGFEVR
jgi:hypothetical protein